MLDKNLALFLGKQDWVKTQFQFEALTLIQNITENRLRHARGPVQFTESITCIVAALLNNIKSTNKKIAYKIVAFFTENCPSSETKNLLCY